MPNSVALILCFFVCTAVQAQFKNKAALGPVTKTGFYSFRISPELSSYVKTDFSDLRVVDGEGKQAEYIVHFSKPPLVKDSILFDTLPIISNQQTDSGKTILVLKTKPTLKTSSLALLLGNASVSRAASVSGSNDGKKWFAMVDEISLEKKHTSTTDKYIETIDLPLVAYQYLKLVINNGKNDPLNIIAAGSYNEIKKGTLLTYLYVPELFNPDCTYQQTDSTDGYSYIGVHCPLPFHIDEIELTVAGPKFFNRDLDIVVPYGEETKYALSSKKYNNPNFHVPVFKAKDWFIKVYNGNNPPLKITKLITSAQMKNIITWLDSGKTYHLELNNANAVAPQYDLQNFKDSIPDNISYVEFGAVEPMAIAAANADKSVFKQSWLWALIIAILAGLLFFTWQLTKELGKKG